jgi:hypothetical protein
MPKKPHVIEEVAQEIDRNDFGLNRATSRTATDHHVRLVTASAHEVGQQVSQTVGGPMS